MQRSLHLGFDMPVEILHLAPISELLFSPCRYDWLLEQEI